MVAGLARLAAGRVVDRACELRVAPTFDHVVHDETATLRPTREVMDTTLSALANRTRRAIVVRLPPAHSPAGRLGHRFSMSRRAISKHLRVLREGASTDLRKVGRQRLYRPPPGGFLQLQAHQIAGSWT